MMSERTATVIADPTADPIIERRSNVRRLVLAAVIAAFGISSLGLIGVPVIANPLQPKSLNVTADFPSTIGLYNGSRVMVQGMAAGSVSTLKSVGDRVRVTMKVHDVDVDPNAVATIRLRSLIGSRYVELSPVWSGQGPKLADGAHIPLARTVVPAEVSDFTDETNRVARELDAQAMGRLVHELGTALEGNGGALAGATSGMAQVGQTVAAQAKALDDSLQQLQRVVGTMAAKDDDIVRILRSSTAVSQGLLAQQGSLDAAVSGLDKLLGTLTDFTSTEKDKIVQAVHLLSTTGKQLADHSQQWSSIVNEVPYYAYGWYNAIHHDDNHWFFMEQVSGIMFLPYPHQLNEGGGPGAKGEDHTVYPSIDFSCSPARAAVPYQVDTTKETGSGPLLPEQNIGNGRIKVDNTPNNAYHSPGYEGGEPQTAPGPHPSGCNQTHNAP
jgi:virulence factor Mce-like protein